MESWETLEKVPDSIPFGITDWLSGWNLRYRKRISFRSDIVDDLWALYSRSHRDRDVPCCNSHPCGCNKAHLVKMCNIHSLANCSLVRFQVYGWAVGSPRNCLSSA